MSNEEIENSAAEQYLFGDVEMNFDLTEENNEILKKYKLIGDTLDDYCGLFYNKRDYSKKIEAAASKIKMKMERDELVFCELKLLGDDIKRIPEIADFIAQTSQTIFRYAAATEYIQFASMEKIQTGNFDVTLKILNNELIINLKKDMEKVSGKIGFVIKKNLREKKFVYDILNGEIRFKLRKNEEIIKNDDSNVFFIVE